MTTPGETGEPAGLSLSEADRIIEPRPRSGPLTLTRVAVALVVAAGAAIPLVWYGLSSPAQDAGVDLASAPLIRASPGPMKERPEDPGGIEIADRDKLVYHRFSGEAGEAPAIERLLPPPEEPQPVPAAPPPPESDPAAVMTPAPPGVASEPIPADASPPAPAAADPTAPPAPPAKSPVPSEPDAGTSAASRDALTDLIQSALATGETKSQGETAARGVARTAGEPAAAGIATASGGYFVQIAALRSRDAADSEWQRLSRRHADLLGGLELRIATAELGERGTYYRVHGGPLATAERARSLCQALADRQVDCLVVGPDG